MNDILSHLTAILGRLCAAVGAFMAAQARGPQMVWIGSQAFAPTTSRDHATTLPLETWHHLTIRLGRLAQRFRTLFARWQSNTLPALRPSRAGIPRRPAAEAHPAQPRLPAARAWINARIPAAANPLRRNPRTPAAQHGTDARLRPAGSPRRPPPAPPLPHARGNPARLPSPATPPSPRAWREGARKALHGDKSARIPSQHRPPFAEIRPGRRARLALKITITAPGKPAPISFRYRNIPTSPADPTHPATHRPPG